MTPITSRCGLAHLALCWMLVSMAAPAQEPPDEDSPSELVGAAPDGEAKAGEEQPAQQARPADDPAAAEPGGEAAAGEAPPPQPGRSADPPPPAAATDGTYAVIPVESADEPDRPEVRSEPVQLDEIVVTATKREAFVRDIPTSIDAFSGEDLEDQGLNDLEGFLKQSPGVILVKNSPDGNQVVIRGSGAAPFSFAFNRPFGLFFEDVPLVNPTLIGVQPDIDTFDLQTVEVLKGPQGTLFGGSALVGAIRYVPNAPQFDESHGSASYGYGALSESADSNGNYTLMLNQPLGSNLAIRLAGSVRQTAGYIEDGNADRPDINGRRADQARILAAWDAPADVKVRLSYLGRRHRSEAVTGNVIDNVDGRLENNRLRGAEDESDSKISVAGARLEWARFDPFTLVWSSNILPKEATFLTDLGPGGTPAGPNTTSSTRRDQKSRQLTHEARIVSNRRTEGGWLFRDWDYVAGLFQLKIDQKNRQEVTSTDHSPLIPDRVLIAIAQAETEERALFFDVTRHMFDDQLDLTLGGRIFEQETPVLLAVRARLQTNGIATAEQPVGNDAVGTLADSGFNPKLGLLWRATDDTSFFTSAAKGFRFGGVNPDPFLTRQPPTFYESDYIWNYELGMRSAWLDNTLHIDMTAFHIDWTNRQLPLLTSAQIRTQFIANIGGSRIRGAEAGIRAILPFGFSAVLNGAYVRSETTKAFNEPSAGTIPAGTLEPNSPLWTGSSILKYTSQWGQFDLDASLAYSYQGKSKNDWQNFAPLDAVNLVDLSCSIGALHWSMSPKLTLNVLNLADSRALLNASATRPEGDPARVEGATVATPRTITMTMSLSY